jgi:hypothetical protein
MADLKSTEQLQRAVHIKIGETLCFPGFLESCKKKKNQSNQGTTPQNIVQNQETEFIEEVSGLTESG